MSYINTLFLKIILIGETGVGKTSLRRSYLGVGFESEHLTTIGADFASLVKKVNDIKITFQIWDLAGQDFFQAVRKVYYKGSLGALLIFDVTDLATLKALDNWVDELEESSGRGIVPFFILGNKIDLVSEKKLATIRMKAQKHVDKWEKKYKNSGFEVKLIFTSAKLGENVQEGFESLGEEIIDFLAFRKKQREN